MRDCSFASDNDNGTRYCRNSALCAPQLSRRVTAETCDSCTACNLTGEPTPQAPKLPPVKSTPPRRLSVPVKQPEPPECQHRSEKPIHHEPCSCGSASKVAVYGCELHKRCVPLSDDVARIKDQTTRESLAKRCCETCRDCAR